VIPTRSAPLTILITICVAACGGTDTRDAPDASATAELDDSTLAALVDQFPRLGAEPLSQPEPSPDATPGTPPERFAARASDAVLETVMGEATFYANSFEGKRTASGIPFRQNQLVAAHRAFPFGTILRVTNLRNNRSVNVRVVDRGPFGSSAARGTVIDLSRRAAERLDFIGAGRTRVRVEVLEWGRGINAA
jgi:rare lipoprotein A